MQLVNEFSVDAPLDLAWSVLTDIPTVIECVPGAELDSSDGDDYHAHVVVKVGPVGMTLTGKATLVSRDDTTKEMIVRGNARDRKGNGSTAATVHMVAREGAGRSIVTVTTDLELTGRIAQFGKGVITQVSGRIIGQFVDRLNTVITGDQPPADMPHATGLAPTPEPTKYPLPETVSLTLTALAGVALGLAIGRWAERLSCSARRR